MLNPLFWLLYHLGSICIHDFLFSIYKHVCFRIVVVLVEILGLGINDDSETFYDDYNAQNVIDDDDCSGNDANLHRDEIHIDAYRCDEDLNDDAYLCDEDLNDAYLCDEAITLIFFS